MAAVRRKVEYEAEKVMGPVAKSLLDRQCQLLGINLDDATKEQVLKLAEELARNSVILIGRPKAEAVREKLRALAAAM